MLSVWLGDATSDVISLLQYLEAATRGVLWKKVPKNFTNVTGKYLSKSLCPCNLIKKEALAQLFSCEFCEISYRFLTLFLQNASRRLILNITMQELQIFHDFQHTFIHLQYSCSIFVRFFEEMSFLQETSFLLTNKINQLQNLVVVETSDFNFYSSVLGLVDYKSWTANIVW